MLSLLHSSIADSKKQWKLKNFKNSQKTKKMNPVEKELHGYINGTERMSGFDSYDSAEGDMSYFDDDDMSYFDNDSMSYAGGAPNAHHALSDPYVVSYTNNTNVAQSCVLFGFNDYGSQSNFGNPATVTLTNVQTGISGSTAGGYGRIINQSNNKFFKVGKWRFQCSTPSQLQITVQLVHVDANGKQYITPLNLSVLRDAYQFQSDIIDVSKTLTVDGNTYLTFSLQASAVLTISIYPVAILSGKAKLNGGSNLNTARAPRLSGKNVAPVIIQTSQDVKGITKG